MGNVAHAVAEFDEAVLAPWRPPLRSSGTGRRSALQLVPTTGVEVPGGPVRIAPAREGASRPVTSGRPAPRPAAPRGAAPRPATPRGAAARPRVAAPAPGLRLTPRARRLAVVLAVGVGVAVGAWVDSLASGGEGEQLRLVGESSVVVRSGDSLWSIAASIAGDEDPRAVIDEIQQLNGLEGAELVPGQTLQLP